jgi:hypothetical protein
MRFFGPSARNARRAWWAVALVLCAAFALSACGGGGKAAEKPPADIEDSLGFDQAGITARQSRVEAAIRDCMRNQGFDYVPIDPVAQRAALFGSGRLTDADFIKQFGYGITTVWGRATAQSDPNQRIRTALSAPDRTAYDRTLWGDHPGTTFASAVDTGDFTNLGGCTKKSTEQVFGGAQVLTQLQGKLDTLEEKISQDQRMVKAVENWSKCMADRGYRYEQPEAIDTDLYKRMEKIVGPVPGQFATGPAPGKKPPPYDRAALQELQREEVAIAVADSDCEHKFITPVENVVAPQYAAAFRRDNKALIGQIKPVR